MGIIHWSLLYWCLPYAAPLQSRTSIIIQFMELTENCTIFGLAGKSVWRMKMLNIYISSYPKGPVALEIKFFKWKFGPTCPLKTQLSLTTIESPNIPSQSHHASFELEELNITKNLHNIALYLKINLQTHAEFCPFFIMAIRRVSVFSIPDLFQRHTFIFFPDKSMAIWALLELDNISWCSIARRRFSLFSHHSPGQEQCGHILLLCLGSWKICYVILIITISLWKIVS